MNDDTHFLYSMSAALANEGKDYHSQRCREIGDAIERLRAVVAVFEADEAKFSSPPDADHYCNGACLAPKLRAAYQQPAPGKTD